MSATPSLEDLANQIKQLRADLDAVRNVSPTSLTIKDRNTGNNIVETGYDTAHSNRSFFKLRDSLGNILVTNDTTQGWGLSLPIMPYVMYPYQFYNDTYPGGTVSSASAMSNAASFYVPYWISGQLITHPVLQYSFALQLFGGATSGQFKLAYTDSNNMPQTIFEVTLSASNFAYAGGYTFPVGNYNDASSLTASCRVAGGTGRVSITPYFLLGYGG